MSSQPFNSQDERDKPDDENQSRPLDFNRLAWFLSGLIVGSILHTTTTLILVISWIIVTNEPLPKVLGGYYPQNILRGIFDLINSRARRKHKNKSPSSSSSSPTLSQPSQRQSQRPSQQPSQQSITTLNTVTSVMSPQPVLTLPIGNVPVIMGISTPTPNRATQRSITQGSAAQGSVTQESRIEEQ